jgi:hypothetical protein
MRQPRHLTAVCYEQLSGVPCTRGPYNPRRGLRARAPAPPSSPPSAAEQLSGVSLTSAVHPTREGGCAPMHQPRHLPAICYRAAVQSVIHARSVKPAKGAACPCAGPAIFPPSAAEQLSGVSLTSAVHPTNHHNHHQRTAAPNSPLAAVLRAAHARSVRSVNGAERRRTAPVIFDLTVPPSATEPLSRVPLTRGFRQPTHSLCAGCCYLCDSAGHEPSPSDAPPFQAPPSI